jgi:hypothetical protein
MKLATWPPELRADVEKHGAAAVNEAGLQALGYPGVMATEQYELDAIRRVLSEPQQTQQKGEQGV